MQGKYYEENMGLYTQLINVITFGGPHRVALLCMLQTHWFEFFIFDRTQHGIYHV